MKLLEEQKSKKNLLEFLRDKNIMSTKISLWNVQYDYYDTTMWILNILMISFSKWFSSNVLESWIVG